MEETIKKALEQLKKDPVMAPVVDRHPLEIAVEEKNLLESIVGAIISQQLSVKAADTIEKRFYGLFGGVFPKPEQIIEASGDDIRAQGISYSKIKYIKGLAQAVIDKQIDLDGIVQKDDEQVIEDLVALKGIGRWTAEMILIFSLYRPDVFSMGDLGLRTAVSKLYGVDRDDLLAIEKITEQWSPYRSFGSRLLWKSLDNEPKIKKEKKK